MFKKIAHSSNLPSLGNKDLKSLQDLIHSEKSVLFSLQKLSTDLSKSSDALKTWGLGEGEDLGDVLSHGASILSHVSNALSVFASHEQTVRELLKSIRSREEKLDETRNRRKAVGSKADAAEKKLSKMGSENKNLPSQTDLLNRLRDEIRQLDSEIMTEEARIGDFKRHTTKNFMTLKLGGLLEFAEKATIVGELGKLLLEEIPMISTVPGENRALYMGHEKTDKLEQEVSRCVNEVVFSAANVLEAENGRFDYTANQSGDNSYSNDQADYPPSQPISPAGTQDNRWPSPMGTVRTMPDHPSGFGPGGRYNSPTVANEDLQTLESSQAAISHEQVPMPIHPQSADRHLAPTSDAPPSIDVSFSSEFNPYTSPSSVAPSYPPPGPENPWRQGSQEQDPRHPGPGEGDYSHDQRAVRFASPSQQPPFPQPAVPEISQQDHSEAPTQPSEESRPSFAIPRIPAPARDPPADNEESLNMAAAQEISREMDSLSRPAPQERAPSPLVPPTLPFANRSVSPGPSSPRVATGEDLVPPRIAIGQRPRSGSGTSSTSNITRGMEFPTPPGARTISAAAFKRAPNRSPNSEGEVRKRTLPSSPYPPYRLNSTSSLGQREMASQIGDQGPSQPPPSSYEDDQAGPRNDVRQSMDVPPSYKSVDDHATY